MSKLIKGKDVRQPLAGLSDVITEVDRAAALRPEIPVVVIPNVPMTLPSSAEPWRDQLETLADEVRKQASEQGYAEGYARGHEEATTRCHNILEEHKQALGSAVNELLANIEGQRHRTMLEARDKLVDLALAIAGRVLKDEVSTRRDVVVNIVKDTLKRVVDKDLVRIRVNVADIPAVKSRRDEIASLVDGIRNLEIVEDRRIGLGGTVIETNAGRLDARIETQLDEIRRAFSETGE